MLRVEKRSRSLLIALRSCCKWGAFICILLLTQYTTIFESPNTCKWDIFLLITTSSIAWSTTSSALLFMHCLGAYLTWTLYFYDKYKTPLEPPSGGSPWLSPSNNYKGIYLLIYGGTDILLLGSFSLYLCSLVHCTTRAFITSWGINLLLNIVVFQVHQIP